ncbi:hypothetical protein IGI37_003325 [Enterococcus sp. AZ194]|uniref:sugar ABC transporter substrate-binding protein n=1 Tax=Enterococcus sp. AZ194 TaxID=2774629 RepID=UPI003F26BD7E
MKMKKLVMSAFIATAVTSLAGCGGGTKEKATKDKNEFTVVNIRYPESTDVYLKKGSVADATKEAGVKINWDTYTTLEWPDKKGVVLGGGDLPDAFWGNTALQDADIANNEASFIPLEDYINEKTMPNMTKIFKEDPKMRAIVTNADGHIYSLPSRMTGRAKVGNQLVINQKWLKNLGLDMPETVEELENVLLAFAKEDADGDGDKTNEVPYTGLGFRMLLPWGIEVSSSPITWMNYDGKELYYQPTTDLYKQTIQHMHKLFKEKAIDQEFFTQDWTSLMNKITEVSVVGVADSYNPLGMGKERGEYVPLPALTGLDGKKHVLMDQDPYSRNQFVVTKNCENPEKLLQWVDKMYTEDASVQTYFGPFGMCTEKNDDGTYTLLTNDEGKLQDDYALNNSMRDWAPQYGSEALDKRIKMLDDQGDGYKHKISAPLESYLGEQYPMLNYKADEQRELSTIQADIDSFVTSKQAEWVTNGGVEKEWNDYISQLKQMGLDRFLEIQNNALKRYNEELKN